MYGTHLFSDRSSGEGKTIFLKAELILGSFSVHRIIEVHTCNVAMKIMPVAENRNESKNQKAKGHTTNYNSSNQARIGGIVAHIQAPVSTSCVDRVCEFKIPT